MLTTNTLQMIPVDSPQAVAAAQGSRPIVNKKTGQTVIVNGRGMVVNSMLKRDEWKEFDTAVVAAARNRLMAINTLRDVGLERRLGGIGTLISQWHQASEMTAANVNMTGQSNGEQDRVDFKLAGVPVPVIFKDFNIGMRQLQAGRQNGDQIDVSNVSAASIVVAESLENMLFNGSSVTLNSTAIYGLTTHPYRSTDTATNYGGGDWGTATNVKGTVVGMMSAAAANGFHGPYGLFVANTQYFQMLVDVSATDRTPLQRVSELPGINFVQPSDWLADGVVVLVQLTPDVVDVAIAQDLTVVEWMSGDGMVGNFKAITIAVPRIKAEYGNKAGVVHATGA